MGITSKYSRGINYVILALRMVLSLHDPFPKGPFRTKNSTGSKFTAGRKFGTEVAKRYGECSEVLVFLGEKRGRKTVRIVKTTAVAKCYGFGRRTSFSTEVGGGEVGA